MNLISILILLLPLSLAIYVSIFLGKRAHLWLEVFAGIVSLTLISYGLIFWLSIKENWILSLVGSISIAQFFGLLIFPITANDHYQSFPFKSLLFDGQSSFAQKVKNIRNSRSLSSLVVFLFFLVSFGLMFSAIGFIEDISQALWLIGLSAMVAVKNAIDWKPSKV
ncbi:hypothetical protein [Candidatus Villigracilis saccharophilus]|uniref:hypothetical protein n=1 Tax=Candidatus Villigracilis saccharophilus TaxID=3140684 RepID=UPI003137505B|nr:hypothetical protein [Anaerolineales bacterium]